MSDRDFVSIESPAEVLTVEERRFAFDVPTGDGVPSSATVTAVKQSDGSSVTGTIFSGGTTCTVSGQRVTMPMAKTWTAGEKYKLDALVTMANLEKLPYRIEVHCVE